MHSRITCCVNQVHSVFLRSKNFAQQKLCSHSTLVVDKQPGVCYSWHNAVEMLSNCVWLLGLCDVHIHTGSYCHDHCDCSCRIQLDPGCAQQLQQFQECVPHVCDLCAVDHNHIHTCMRRFIENCVIAVLIIIAVVLLITLIHNIAVYGWMYWLWLKIVYNWHYAQTQTQTQAQGADSHCRPWTALITHRTSARK